MRDRQLDAAGAITAESGWGTVTMTKIADRVGVSRQTVYNELAKAHIAEELVLRELERFLEVVGERLLAHTEVVAGVRAAAEAALELAGHNPLLRAALTSAHVGGNDPLPLLTTNSERLIDRAGAVVLAIIDETYGDLGVTGAQLATMVDSIVRLVLSHILQPRKSSEQSADDIAWIAARVLAPPR